jgi:NAD(P)-dependent dehydrogenase (short-subunit alcohol dehydrogenase family)
MAVRLRTKGKNMTRSPHLLVTGGSRGIGAAIVRLACEDGFQVSFTYATQQQAALALVQEVEAKGARAQAIQAELGDPACAPRVFDEAEKGLGPVTALVNNAGITGPLGRFEQASLETLRRVLDVNVLATMAFSQQAVRRWRAAASAGCIVNVSSIAASLGAPGEYVHYAAAKAAVEGFTVGLGKELAAESIRVNAVSPGTTLTDIHAAAGEPGRPARVAARIPMQRPARPQEIAEAVRWLLTERASYVTATVLRAAGGL